MVRSLSVNYAARQPCTDSSAPQYGLFVTLVKRAIRVRTYIRIIAFFYFGTLLGWLVTTRGGPYERMVTTCASDHSSDIDDLPYVQRNSFEFFIVVQLW